MADLNGVFGETGFNTNSVEPNEERSYELIPTGWVAVEIVESDLRYTKDTQGQYIYLDFAFIGEFQNGRHMFNNYNILNKNEKAMEIAYRDVGAIGQAIGVPNFKRTEQFLNAQLMIKVIQKKNKLSGKMENAIGNYAKLGAHSEQVAKAAAQPAFQPPVQQQQTQQPAFQPPVQPGLPQAPAAQQPVAAGPISAPNHPWLR